MQLPTRPAIEQRGRVPRRPAERPVASISHVFDNLDLPAFVRVAAGFGHDRFGFVVTPNVDHMIRCHEDAAFRSIYAQAAYVLLDSRFAKRLLRVFKGSRLPVCTGSDLSLELLQRVIGPADRIVVVGTTPARAKELATSFGLQDMQHFNPPMGFINDPEAVEECLQFIEQSSPFRFCFLAVGSPQQEWLAALLQQRAIARGMALCVGAAINFVTGAEKRAPAWMQGLALEWLYRLLANPRRLAYRYLVRGPRIFRYLLHARIDLRLHDAAETLPGPDAAYCTRTARDEAR